MPVQPAINALEVGASKQPLTRGDSAQLWPGILARDLSRVRMPARDAALARYTLATVAGAMSRPRRARPAAPAKQHTPALAARYGGVHLTRLGGVMPMTGRAAVPRPIETCASTLSAD